VTNGWHYAEGGKAVGPLDSKEMQVILSKISDPRNLQVWKVGFKGWERAGNVPELAEFIQEPQPLLHEPPPLPHEPPPLPKTTHRTSQGIWRSASAIGVCVAVAWTHSGPYAAFAALLIAIPLDWATRRRQQFVQRLRQDIEHRMMAAR
jgi:GYF domain 2